MVHLHVREGIIHQVNNFTNITKIIQEEKNKKNKNSFHGIFSVGLDTDGL